MNLRNALLAISMIVIGFSLTLYFQTEQPVQSMNYDQYQSLQYNESRSHSLDEFNKKIVPLRLEEVISEIYEKNKLAREKTRVMEIGFGNGRVLMELKKLFPDIEFYGINKEKTRTFYRRESFILTALKFNIMTDAEVEGMELPYVIFQDVDYGQAIPYDENKFDVIFSQNTIPYIRYTFELFNDILRILKPGGVSLHADVTGVNFFIKGINISLKEATKEFRKKGLEVYVLDSEQSIRFKKTNSASQFPVSPHQPIPENIQNLSSELRRPEMSYNLEL